MREGEKEVWDLGRTAEHTSLESQEVSSRGRKLSAGWTEDMAYGETGVTQTEDVQKKP